MGPWASPSDGVEFAWFLQQKEGLHIRGQTTAGGYWELPQILLSEHLVNA